MTDLSSTRLYGQRGGQGRIHDHAQAWTAYGVLDGMERLERYRRIDDGKKSDYALIQLKSVSAGAAGKIDLVQPVAMHSEKGVQPDR